MRIWAVVTFLAFIALYTGDGYIYGKRGADEWYAEHQPKLLQTICAPLTLREDQDFTIEVPSTYKLTVSNNPVWAEHFDVTFTPPKGKP